MGFVLSEMLQVSLVSEAIPNTSSVQFYLYVKWVPLGGRESNLVSVIWMSLGLSFLFYETEPMTQNQ